MPAIAAETEHLTVFQRTPIWVAPRIDEPFTSEQQELFASDPAEALKLRDAAFQQYEVADFDVESDMTKMLTEMSYNYLMKKVSDPQLRSKLLPDYPVGCKRPLQSKTWFPVFDLPNVTLETAPIVAFTEQGLRTADGVEHRADTVIFGTGFKAADYLSSLDVYGNGGRRLHDDWRQRRRSVSRHRGARLSESVHAVRAEHQRDHLDDLHPGGAGRIRAATDHTMSRETIEAVEIKRGPHDAFNAEIQAALDTTVWAANCSNYFRHPSGKMVTQYPYSGSMFAQRLAAVDLDLFDTRPQSPKLKAEAGNV